MSSLYILTMTWASYDDHAIWGLGDSPSAAMADGRRWYPVSDGKPPKLATAEITLRLEVIVRQHYHGRSNFILRDDGVLDIPSR
jgi:hypothetical protein